MSRTRRRQAKLDDCKRAMWAARRARDHRRRLEAAPPLTPEQERAAVERYIAERGVRRYGPDGEPRTKTPAGAGA